MGLWKQHEALNRIYCFFLDKVAGSSDQVGGLAEHDDDAYIVFQGGDIYSKRVYGDSEILIAPMFFPNTGYYWRTNIIFYKSVDWAFASL